MSLRTDENQWLIYQEAPVRAVVAGVEALLMGLGAETLVNHEDQAIRAIGHFGRRVAETRMTYWAGQMGGEPTDEQHEVVKHLSAIAKYLIEGNRPDDALDEIHAAVVWADKRAREAGVMGDGWYREIIRGD